MGRILASRALGEIRDSNRRRTRNARHRIRIHLQGDTRGRSRPYGTSHKRGRGHDRRLRADRLARFHDQPNTNHEMGLDSLPNRTFRRVGQVWTAFALGDLFDQRKAGGDRRGRGRHRIHISPNRQHQSSGNADNHTGARSDRRTRSRLVDEQSRGRGFREPLRIRQPKGRKHRQLGQIRTTRPVLPIRHGRTTRQGRKRYRVHISPQQQGHGTAQADNHGRARPD